jgi:hypothetical protein
MRSASGQTVLTLSAAPDDHRAPVLGDRVHDTQQHAEVLAGGHRLARSEHRDRLGDRVFSVLVERREQLFWSATVLGDCLKNLAIPDLITESLGNGPRERSTSSAVLARHRDDRQHRRHFGAALPRRVPSPDLLVDERFEAARALHHGIPP